MNAPVSTPENIGVTTRTHRRAQTIVFGRPHYASHFVDMVINAHSNDARRGRERSAGTRFGRGPAGLRAGASRAICAFVRLFQNKAQPGCLCVCPIVQRGAGDGGRQSGDAGQLASRKRALAFARRVLERQRVTATRITEQRTTRARSFSAGSERRS